MNKFLWILTSTIFLFSISVKTEVTIEELSNGLKITTEYGEVFLDQNKVEDQVVIDLIKSKAFQRLQFIHQYGPSHYAKPQVVYKAKTQSDYTRFEHSIGVFILLKRFKATPYQQIAGLLHDISHTAFSHVGDLLFKKSNDNKVAYQDQIHEQFLKNHGIIDILESYQVPISKILTSNVKVLKQEAPNICADNLEYTLKGSLLAGYLKIEDISEILADLRLDRRSGVWSFTNPIIAKKFGEASLLLSRDNSGSIWNAVLYKLTALALKKAFSIQLISPNEFLYDLGDNEIWIRLATSTDSFISHLRECLMEPDKTYQIIEPSNKDHQTISIQSKFRGLNPLIKEFTKKGYVYLTELDTTDFKNNFYGIKYLHNKKYIKFVNGYQMLFSALLNLEQLIGH